MAGVIQRQGLLSLHPSNPQTRAFHPLQTLRTRSLSLSLSPKINPRTQSLSSSSSWPHLSSFLPSSLSLSLSLFIHPFSSSEEEEEGGERECVWEEKEKEKEKEKEIMAGVIQRQGLLSLHPSNPQTRAFHPLQTLRTRSLSLSPKINPRTQSLSSSFRVPSPQPLLLKRPLLLNKKRDISQNTFRCASAAAAGADAAADVGDNKKLLGVEVVTLKKIIPLGIMFFCILFNYTILRDTKDVLVVTAKGSSAEIIPFLKTWVNLPMAVGFMLLYTKLSNVLSKEALFYSVIFPFIAFFGAFGFVLYPLSEAIHPTALADRLLAALGPSFLGPVAILRIWSFCLFYVMAELWGSVVISVLFWGFANQITTVEEAKEFYPLFGLGANIALIFSGRTVKYFSNMRKNLGPGVDGWAVSLKGMMSIVVLLGLVITGIYWGVNKFVLNDPSLPRSDRKKKEKPKLGMKESLKVLISSRYVRDLATLVVAYGISINLVEVTWKSKLKAQFPSPNEYSSFMGDFSTATGIATFTMMLLGRVILRKFGWGVAAMITPTVLLLTGVGFFSLLLFGEPLAPVLGSLGITPLLAAVYVGALQNIFSKSAKYSLFDPCKEMAYIPLDEDMKVKGKAAIDVVCNPLGKSGGALIQQFMILTFGSLANSTPYLGGILLVIVLAWLGAAKSLDSQFSPLAKQELEKEKRVKTLEPVVDVDVLDVKEQAKFKVDVKEQAKVKETGSILEPVSTVKPSNGPALKQNLAPESESSTETTPPHNK